MGVYKRVNSWMVNYKDQDGNRHDKSFGKLPDAYERACEFDAMQKEIKAAKIKCAILPEQPAKRGPKAGFVKTGTPILKLTNMFIEHLKVSGRSRKHIDEVYKLVTRHVMPVVGLKPVEQMTYVDDMMKLIKSWQKKSSLTGRPRSQSTVNRYGDYLNAIFNFGVEMDIIPSNPMRKRKKSKERPRDVQLTVDDLKKIIAVAEPHVKWALEVTFNLGTRPGASELFALKWEHVDFDKGEVKIYAPKTNTYRFVPVNPDFLERLRKVMVTTGSKYIIEYARKPVKSIRHSYQAACKKAKIPYHSIPYDLRHLFATTLLNNGAALSAVSNMMGHSTHRMTTEVYYHCRDNEKVRAATLLPSVA